jgi:hypothetical protein
MTVEVSHQPAGGGSGGRRGARRATFCEREKKKENVKYVFQK